MLHGLTPGAILDFWIGPAAEDYLAAQKRNKLWFIKSEKTDRLIQRQYEPVLQALAADQAAAWRDAGPRARLAAIIVFDQFSRNIYRGQTKAFAQDAMALSLAQDALDARDDEALTEVERSFLYLPFEHSEAPENQARSVDLFERLAREARPAFKPICQNALDYAYQHRDVIAQFGRFPHRNAILGRKNTQAEAVYLAKPGSGF